MQIQNTDKIALIYKDIEISYRKFLDKVFTFSNAINVKKGDKAVIFAENSPEWVYTFLAIWKNEGIFIPIDSASKDEELKRLLIEVRPSFIFTNKNREANLKKILESLDFEIKLTFFEELEQLPDLTFPAAYLELGDDADNVSSIVFTSGTSKTPLAVMLTKTNMFSVVKALLGNRNFITSDKVLTILPFHHTFPLLALLTSLILNIPTIIPENISTEEILRLTNRYKATMIIAVPMFYSLLHKKLMQTINERLITKILFFIAKTVNSRRLSRLIFRKVYYAFGGNIRYLVSGGAPLSFEVERDLQLLGLNVKSGYGMTEASPLITMPDVNDKRLGSVGMAANCEIKIIDGEIVVKGCNIMKGYYNNPEETEKVLKDGWLYTGDYGHLDKDGFVYVTGRKKDLIVLDNGKKLWPEEIENKLLTLTKIIDELVVVEKQGKLLVVVSPNKEALAKSSIEEMKRNLYNIINEGYNKNEPSYKRISDIRIINEPFPRTRIMKLKRHLILELLNDDKI